MVVFECCRTLKALFICSVKFHILCMLLLYIRSVLYVYVNCGFTRLYSKFCACYRSVGTRCVTLDVLFREQHPYCVQRLFNVNKISMLHMQKKEVYNVL